MKQFAPALLASLLLPLTASADGVDPPEGFEPKFQVFLGVLELDDQTGEWQDISDDDVDVDFSSLPSGGIEGEYVYYKGWVHAGLNPGGSIAWKNDDTNFSGGYTDATGGVLRVDVDNSLLLVELHLGAYIRGRFSDRITGYLAGGPMVMYGSHEVEDENVEPVPQANGTVVITEQDSDDINIGYYARAGIDFETAKNQQLGLGVRYMSTELDFDNTVGKLDIEGPQYVLTFTQKF